MIDISCIYGNNRIFYSVKLIAAVAVIGKKILTVFYIDHINFQIIYIYFDFILPSGFFIYIGNFHFVKMKPLFKGLFYRVFIFLKF